MSPSYALPADQRTRLIRSTRKLEAVLGATPHLVDAPAVYLLPIGSTTSTKALRREGRIFTHSASSSVSSFSSYDSISSSDFYSSESEASRSPSPVNAHPHPFESSASLALYTPIPHKKSNIKSKSKSRSNVPLPRPLLLRLQAVPLPHSTTSIPSTPLSPTTLISPTASPTPTAITFHASDLDTQCAKRKKLAKLTRTLGENVPPELVFPPGRYRNRRRSASVNLVSGSVSESVGRRPREYEYEYGYRREQGWSGEWNNKDMEDVRKALRALKV